MAEKFPAGTRVRVTTEGIIDFVSGFTVATPHGPVRLREGSDIFVERLAPPEPTALGAVIRVDDSIFVRTHSRPGSNPWYDVKIGLRHTWPTLCLDGVPEVLFPGTTMEA